MAIKDALGKLIDAGATLQSTANTVIIITTAAKMLKVLFVVSAAREPVSSLV